MLWLVLLAGTGCAAGTGGPGTGLPSPEDAARIDEVPFYPDDNQQCGPVSLAAVLNFHGAGISPREVSSAVFRSDLKGSLFLDLILYARDKGFSAKWFAGRPEDLIRAVKARRPLIVMIDQGLAGISRNHFMVVIGYDHRGIIAHSGLETAKFMSWSDFLGPWARADHLILDVRPKTNRPEEEIH